MKKRKRKTLLTRAAHASLRYCDGKDSLHLFAKYRRMWLAGYTAGAQDTRKRFKKSIADERWQVQLNHRQHVEALRAELVAAHEKMSGRQTIEMIWPDIERIKQR